ncbi:cadherin repeat domain-containing protein [Sphingobacterium corticis]|uniref:Cadherin repeat domain-containing protein n=1 Tax=Sphingobacterium corticis TaxID=1812823 RepID=A0ABW5NJ78_9SPHI
MSFKHQINRLAMLLSLLLSVLIFSNCKKEETPQDIPMGLPADLSIPFGRIQEIELDKSSLDKKSTQFSLDFSNIENLAITSNLSLRQYLEKGIIIDHATKKIIISTEELFPNGATSAIDGKQIPDYYQVTVIATDQNGAVVGRQNVNIKIQSPNIRLINKDTDANAEFSYMLYGETENNHFNLSLSDDAQATGTWKVATKSGSEQIANVSGNTLTIKALVNKKDNEETSVTIQSSFEKDGFTIASRDFRIIFIPQIKFFFGQYYPEYDLTINMNLIHIALSNAYVSSAPAFFPEKYKGKFRIDSIEKDGKAFDDVNNIFSIDESSGIIRVMKNQTLSAGRYTLTVEAKTTVGLTMRNTLTLAMEPLTE